MLNANSRLLSFCTLSLLATGMIACAPENKTAVTPAVQLAVPKVATAKRVLVVGKDAAVFEAVQAWGKRAQVEVEMAGDDAFTLANLARFRAVVFWGASAQSLNAAQRTAFEGYIQSGGGFVGVHATGGNWHWFRRMNGELVSTAKRHEQKKLEASAKAEAAKLAKGEGNGIHQEEIVSKAPVQRSFDGGRAWVRPESIDLKDLDALEQVVSGITYAGRLEDPFHGLDLEKRRPTDDFFQVDELVADLEDPMEIAPLPDGQVLILERLGAIKVYVPGKGVRKLAMLDVAAQGKPGYKSDWFEGGGLGIAVDPDYGVKNDFVYIFYSLPDAPGPDAPGKHTNRLSRFRLVDGDLLAYEKVLLDVPDDRHGRVCHVGGSLCFGKDRLLFVACGDNANPFESGGRTPIDERPGRWKFDAQRTSGNMNDLRGGISRIRINETGDGYTIPAGNLFPPGTDKTRPELFVKGCRNVWRIGYDSKTGGISWGDVGPDAGGPDANRGPTGYDCIGFAPTAGYYGWPYARGPRDFYVDYDFASGKSGASFADGITNDSPNNTGPQKLPEVRPALMWYTHGGVPQFPEIGGGGRTACVSVIYNQEGRARSLPAWYDRVIFFHEWTRERLDLVKLDDDNQVEEVFPFLRNRRFLHPSDMAQDAMGNLYILEYGTKWTGNKNGRLLKVAFKGWKYPPVITLDPDERFGGLKTPFVFEAKVATAEDKPATAVWDFGDGEKAEGLKVSHVYAKSGRYTATLTVTDADGIQASSSVPVSAGNTYPEVKVGFKGAPKAIPWGEPLGVEVDATDAEDGDLSADVKITASFGVPFNKPLPDPRLIGLDPALRGTQLMADNACVACHSALSENVGPSYIEVAKRYKNDPKRIETLTHSITQGISGKWGAHSPMPSFADLPKGDVADLVAAIHSLANPTSIPLPVKDGMIQLPKERPAGIPDSAVLTVHATVMDKGVKGLIPLSATGSATLK